MREGLDLPEVSLVAILDADKEGFLRSHRSLTQTAGRAARNVNGKVIMYADSITESMQKTIDETLRRREKQLEYNAQHHITPTQIKRSIKEILPTKNISMGTNIANEKMKLQKYDIPSEELPMVADPIIMKMTKAQLEKSIQNTTALMKEAAKNLDFLQAAQYRDEILRLQAELEQK